METIRLRPDFTDRMIKAARSITDPQQDKSTLPHEFYQFNAFSKYRRPVKLEPFIEGMSIFRYEAQAPPSVDRPAQPERIREAALRTSQRSCS
jgi:hypothetical protein